MLGWNLPVQRRKGCDERTRLLARLRHGSNGLGITPRCVLYAFADVDQRRLGVDCSAGGSGRLLGDLRDDRLCLNDVGLESSEVGDESGEAASQLSCGVTTARRLSTNFI